MTTMNIFDMTDTWNASGTTFAAIKMDVTDTASASGSLLMDLQVGGASKLFVSKGGEIFLSQAGGNGAGLIAGGSSFANARAYIGQYGLRLYNTGSFQWSSGTNLNALDLTLTRDAANTLAQRNSTNAQAFRLYNTYTDASNYERGFMQWSSNVLQIGTEAAGTGTARPVEINAGSYINLNIGGSNKFGVGGTANVSYQPLNMTAGKHIEFYEGTAPAAPSVDRVRIYAEDDGAGKTRLMALFASGAAQQIAIEP